MKTYEVLEHTADVGLRIYGKSLDELFQNASSGFFSLVTDVEKIKNSGAEPHPFALSVQGGKTDDLLLKWLRELLFTFSTEKLVFQRFDFKELTGTKLEAIGLGYLFDPAKHEQRMEVKAVTYHQFKLEKQDSLWVAEVILDI